MEHLFADTVGEAHREAARNGNKHCLSDEIGMSATCLAAAHVVDVKDALYGERHMASSFHEREVTAGIADFGKFNYSRLLKRSIGCHVAKIMKNFHTGKQLPQSGLLADRAAPEAWKKEEATLITAQPRVV